MILTQTRKQRRDHCNQRMGIGMSIRIEVPRRLGDSEAGIKRSAYGIVRWTLSVSVLSRFFKFGRVWRMSRARRSPSLMNQASCVS